MLTNTAIQAVIRQAKASGKQIKKFDERGLYLLCKPNGAALWRFKYAFDGVEKGISFGNVSDVPLKRAREKRDEARKLVADGVDPSALRKAAKAAQADSMERISREWLERQESAVSPGTLRRDRQRLEKFIWPRMGNRPIRSITPPEILDALRRIESRGHRETAHRVLAVIRRVLSYAIATGRADRNIALDIQGALAPVITKSFAAITEPRAIGKLLRAIDGYDGTPVVCAALRLSPLLFTRPGELRRCEWRELDLDTEYPEWRIPAEKMKMRDAHIVPLSRQSVSILRELQLHTGKGRYVFPSARGGGRPMSENTVNVALRALGYDGDTQVAHGFRVIASTRLNELGWHGDLIELQLAHKPRGVRAIYNRSERIEERRRMMQSWADHLDHLSAADTNVVPIRSREVANAI